MTPELGDEPRIMRSSSLQERGQPTMMVRAAQRTLATPGRDPRGLGAGGDARPDPFLRAWIEQQVNARVDQAMRELLDGGLPQSFHDAKLERERLEHKVHVIAASHEQLIAAFQNLAEEIEIVKGAFGADLKLKDAKAVTHEDIEQRLEMMCEELKDWQLGAGQAVQRLIVEAQELMGRVERNAQDIEVRFQEVRTEVLQEISVGQPAAKDSTNSEKSRSKDGDSEMPELAESLRRHTLEVGRALSDMQLRVMGQVTVCRSELEQEIALLQRQVTRGEQLWISNSTYRNKVDDDGACFKFQNLPLEPAQKDNSSFAGSVSGHSAGGFSIESLSGEQERPKVSVAKPSLSTLCPADAQQLASGDVRRAAPHSGPFPGRKISTSPRRVESTCPRVALTTVKDELPDDGVQSATPMTVQAFTKHVRSNRLGGKTALSESGLTGPLPSPSLLTAVVPKTL